MPRPLRPPPATPPPHRWARRRLLLTAALSVVGHGGLLLALLTVRGDAPATPPLPEPVTLELVAAQPPPPQPPPQPPQNPSTAPPSPAKPAAPAAGGPPPKALARPTPPHPAAETLAAGTGPSSDQAGQLSDAQVAGAATAGSSGRPCDMTRRLQTALRKDARVQAAVADAQLAAPGGKALLVWNGDWVRSNGQDGNGLAAVREAIMWEVAFAPGPCRTEPVHGLILVSLSDSPGAARLVVGAGDWRWSDLLGLRR